MRGAEGARRKTLDDPLSWFNTVVPDPARDGAYKLRRNFERSSRYKEKDCGKGQEGQDTSHDETETIVPNEIQHFASSLALAITRKRW